MKIGVPKEIHAGEKRVATTPEVIGHLKKLGFEVLVEAGAGAGARAVHPLDHQLLRAARPRQGGGARAARAEARRGAHRQQRLRGDVALLHGRDRGRRSLGARRRRGAEH